MKKILKLCGVVLVMCSLSTVPVSATEGSKTTVIKYETRSFRPLPEKMYDAGGRGGAPINLHLYTNRFGISAAGGGGGRFTRTSRDYIVRDSGVNSYYGTHGGSYYKRYVNGRLEGTYAIDGRRLRP